MQTRRVAALAVVFVLAGVAGFLLTRPAAPPPARPGPVGAEPITDPLIVAALESTAVGLPPLPRSARTGAEIFGFNEAVGIAQRTRSVVMGALSQRVLLDRRASRVRSLGATLVRVNSHLLPYLSWDALKARDFDWRASDTYFGALDRARLDAVVVIGPWPGARTSAHTDRYLPDDLDAYAAYVTAVVERYDGDGQSDMPGLRRGVLAWEVDNEPDLHHTTPARGAARRDDADVESPSFEPPEEYAEVLTVTAAAVRAADPDALVLSGGIYRPMTAQGRDYLDSVLAAPGVLEAIDGISLHSYFADDHLEVISATMETARTLAPDKLVWITETSVPADGRKAWVTEAWQAQMVPAVYGAFLAEGADRVLWHSLVDPDQARPDGRRTFSSNSLLRVVDPLRRELEEKPAAEVYRRLAEVMAEVDPQSIREIAAEGGRVLETDRGWLAFWRAPRTPDGATEALDLLTGLSGPAEDTTSAPAWLPR